MDLSFLIELASETASRFEPPHTSFPRLGNGERSWERSMGEGSSSEIEFIARGPSRSPVKPAPRRSARDRRPPRSKDDLAAPAAARPGQSSATRTGDQLRLDANVSGRDSRDDDEADADARGFKNKLDPDLRRPQASTSKVTLEDAESSSSPLLVSEPKPRATATTTSAAAGSASRARSAPDLTSRAIDAARSATAAPAARRMPLHANPKPSTSAASSSLRATASLPTPNPPSAPAPALATAPAPVPKARNSSSDEADDFFARKRPRALNSARAKAPRLPATATATATATGRRPGAAKVPGRAKGASLASIASKSSKAKGTLQLDSSSDGETSASRVPRVSSPAARPGSARLAAVAANAAIASSSPPSSPARRPHHHNHNRRRQNDDSSDDDDDTEDEDDEDDDSDAASDADSPSGSDPENLFSSSAVRPKSLKLPEWARGGIARYSGADLERMKRGAGKNRKRKRLDVDSTEEEDEDGGVKGKGRANKTGLDAFDGMGGSMWEKQLAATKQAAVAGGSANRRPGDLEDDDLSVESDDSLEAEFAVYQRPEAEPAVRRRAVPTRSRSRSAAASASASASPARRESSSRAHMPPPTGGTLRSPRKFVEAQRVAAAAKATEGVLVVTSGDEDEEMLSVRRGMADDDDDDAEKEEDGDGEGYLPNIERIRSSLLVRSASVEQHQHGAPPVPLIPGAFAAPAAASSATADQSQQEIEIKLKMVFDPTRNAPEVAKRAYERLETFKIGLDESFSSLFYELAVRRTIPRDDLVITHCRNMHLSTPLTLARQTQVYEFGTPASLGLTMEAEIEMRGYTRDVWDKCKEQERAKRIAAGGGRRDGHAGDKDDDDDELEAAAAAAAIARRSAGPRPINSKSGVLDLGSSSDSGGGRGNRVGSPPSSSASSSAGPTAPNLDGLFPLTMRGSSTQSLSVAVKPSTTVAQLVRAYCRHFKLGTQRLVLVFEGETLDPTRTVDDVKVEFDLDGEETFDVKEA